MKLESQLSKILPLIEEDPILNCPVAIKFCMDTYDTLRLEFLKIKCHPKEEIDFFKNCKPQITSKIIYFNERFIIETNKPLTSKKQIKKYYLKQVKKIEQYTQDHSGFFKYYRNRHTYLDAKYFLRNHEDYNLEMDSFCFQNDKLFATSHDFKVAQIIANMELHKHLQTKLKVLKKKKSFQHTKLLKWTGPKVALIELIFALHTVGVFNHGASDIREIAKGFSCAFDMDLGQFYRTFHEISNRKSDRTKFLNTLKESLINRMDQSDEF